MNPKFYEHQKVRFLPLRKNLALITLLLFAFAANAQEVKTLTLKDAIKFALENKAEAKKARLDIENGEYEIQETKSRALPQITATGNLIYNPILQLTPFDASFLDPTATGISFVPFGQAYSSTAGVSLNQAIFDLAVFTGLKAARSTREFYQINSQLTEEQVIERVANNYYQVYVRRQNLNVLDSNFVNTGKVRDIIKGQFDNGLAKKIDLDRIVVRLSNISTQRQQALNAVQLQENSLKFYMGMPIETQIIVPQDQFEMTSLPPIEMPDATNRTEYLLLKKQEQLLTFQKKAIEAEYYPTLSASAAYNYFGTGNEFPLFGKPADGVYWTDYSSVALNLRIPIFTGFGTRARVRQADVDLRRTKADLEDTKLSLDLAFENSRKQIENSMITIKNQQENARLAQEVLSDTRNNYQQGLASLTDLLDAEYSLTEAQNNYTSALLDYKLAEVQLVKSQGQLKTLLN